MPKSATTPPFDALLLVSFGGPEGPDDVMPFLENVLRGKNVPRQRMLEVAEHYKQFGGVSPINKQNRTLLDAIKADFREHDLNLPAYWGNRNWRPLLPDTLRQMQSDGIQRAAAFFTSAFSSYSGCRQYRENIEAARREVGPGAPAVEKLRVFFNHPGFVEPMREVVSAAFEQIPAERRADALLLFTAHSIPLAMAEHCQYVAQLRESCRLVSEGIGRTNWKLVFQSRSGPPSQPWLEPDVCDTLESEASHGVRDVVLAPIGFISDHLEVLYDLDVEAAAVCRKVGLNMVRARTAATHPRFVRMVRELVVERIENAADRASLGDLGPGHDVCPDDCCTYAPRRPARPAGS